MAGEASGDQHGAALVRAMKASDAALAFHGVGGSAMRAAGVRLCIDAADLAVVGITEAVAKLPVVYKSLRRVKALLKRLQPDLVILIDFPEFNLRAAAAAKRAGIPVLYYVSPQIWAWRPGRVKRIARLVDHMAVILPFEEKFYRRQRVKVTFVGHPLLDDASYCSPNRYRPRGVGDRRDVVGLLPGSRPVEVSRHLPVMLEAAKMFHRRHPETRFVLSRAAGLREDLFERALERFPLPAVLSTAKRSVGKLLADCDAVVAVSGTVTLEAALCGTPMIIIYRVSPLSYWIGRALIRVPFIGLVNLVAGRKLAAELIQKDVSAGRITAELEALLSDTDALAENRRQLLALRHRLGGSGASARVADIALSMLR